MCVGVDEGLCCMMCYQRLSGADNVGAAGDESTKRVVGMPTPLANAEVALGCGVPLYMALTTSRKKKTRKRKLNVAMWAWQPRWSLSDLRKAAAMEALERLSAADIDVWMLEARFSVQ